MRWIISSILTPLLLLLPYVSSGRALRSTNNTSYEPLEELSMPEVLSMPTSSNLSHDDSTIHLHEFLSILKQVDKDTGKINEVELEVMLNELGHAVNDEQKMNALINDWVTNGSMLYDTKDLYI